MTARALFVCAHGAGGHKDDRSMLRLAGALEARGFDVERFNFPYREAGSKRIDPMPVLKQSFISAVEKVRGKRRPLIIGGRSLGGRVASMLAAEGFACDGLLLAAYPLHPAPLHPAGQPEKLRDAHLPRIPCAVLRALPASRRAASRYAVAAARRTNLSATGRTAPSASATGRLPTAARTGARATPARASPFSTTAGFARTRATARTASRPCSG